MTQIECGTILYLSQDKESALPSRHLSIQLSYWAKRYCTAFAPEYCKKKGGESQIWMVWYGPACRPKDAKLVQVRSVACSHSKYDVCICIWRHPYIRVLSSAALTSSVSALCN